MTAKSQPSRRVKMWGVFMGGKLVWWHINGDARFDMPAIYRYRYRAAHVGEDVRPITVLIPTPRKRKAKP